MAYDIFLKIESDGSADNISGGSTDKQHKNEIDIASYNWGEEQGSSGGLGGGGGAGKARAQDFHFVANTSVASPKLFRAVATGTHFKKATVTVTRPSRDARGNFLTWLLEDVLISSYRQVAGNADSAPADQFTLSFGQLTMTITEQKPDGSSGASVSERFDYRNNKSG